MTFKLEDAAPPSVARSGVTEQRLAPDAGALQLRRSSAQAWLGAWLGTWLGAGSPGAGSAAGRAHNLGTVYEVNTNRRRKERDSSGQSGSQEGRLIQTDILASTSIMTMTMTIH
eukprot:COSAG02_NODE_514_length_20825_cov_5.990495_1_plen_114_part_00